ncbi:hypothetical protein CI102_3946 [Trichoderma harzianum]|nr:hypothetical protein CI102_3946 [Trichoderma harzianum]
MDRSRRKTPPAWKQNSESIYSILSLHPCHTTYLPLNRRTAALMGARVHYDQPRRSCEREKKRQTDTGLDFLVGPFFFFFFFFFFHIIISFFLFLMSDIPLRHHTTPLSMCSAARRRMVTKGSIGSGPVAENEIEARKGGRVTSWAWVCIERRGRGSSSISRVTVQKLASFVRREDVF